MLTVKQAHGVLLMYHFCSYMAILPIKVDLVLGKVQLQTCPRRWFSWNLSFWLNLMRCGQAVAYVIYMRCYPAEAFAYHDLPMFILVVVAATLLPPGMYTVFVRCPEVTMTIFNELLSVKGTGLTIVYISFFCNY